MKKSAQIFTITKYQRKKRKKDAEEKKMHKFVTGDMEMMVLIEKILMKKISIKKFFWRMYKKFLFFRLRKFPRSKL